jgi:hypothetical protein
MIPWLPRPDGIGGQRWATGKLFSNPPSSYWLLGVGGDNILPIPGTKKRAKLADNAGSVDVVLTPQTLTQLDELLQR